MFSILYVDDEPGLLEIGKLFLEQDGRFTVNTLTSAAEALEVLRTRHYDAIISDYQMPVMNGIEFLKRVRASGSKVPFIIFTGRGREEVVIQALNEGADFYLQKGGEPVSQFTELGHKVHMAILQRRAEASIRDHERREADIINFLPDATFAIDTKGTVIAWNRAIEKMTGVMSSEILGKGDHEYALPFYHERRPLLIDLVLREDPEIAAKYPAITRDGTTLFSEITIPHFNNGRGAELWFTASPLYDNTGTVIGAIESIREITDRKRIEVALRESERFLNSVVENIPDMIFVKDARDLRYVRFNKAGEELLGYTRETLSGKNDFDFFPQDEADFFVQKDRLVLDNRKAIDIPEENIRTRHKGERILHTKKIPILDEKGIPVYLMGISEDITKRKQVENDLRNSAEFLNSLIDQSPTPMWISDEMGTLLRINRACCDLLKITENEVVGKYSLFDDNIVKDQGFMPLIHDVFDKGIVARFQLIYDTSRLNIALEKRVSLLLDVTIFPVRDSRGVITNAVIQHADITRRRQSEAALIESEQKYRTVFETTGTATVLIENDGTISLANSEFARLSGYPKAEIENQKKWTDFVLKEDLDRMLEQHQLRRRESGAALAHYEFRFRRRSGEVRDIYLSIDIIPGTTKSVASLLDITERKQVESSLISAKLEYTNLLDQIQDIYYRSDTAGRLVKASRSWATLLGYDDLSECLGRNIADDFYVNPADRIEFLEKVYRDGRVSNYEVLLKKKDKSAILVSTSSHLYYDPAGNILGIEGTFRDITERKLQEHILRTQLDLGLKLQLLRDRDEILDACLNAAIEISGMDAGGIYLVDETDDSIDLIISRNLGEEFLSTIAHYNPGSANARIVRAGIPIYTEYRKTGISHTAIQEREGLRAAAIIPVKSRGRVIACLNITSHTKDSIPAEARIALETIATQIGAAIDRVRTDEALQESEQRYRNVVEDQTEFISRFLPDGTHVFVNDAYCRYFSLKRDEIIGHQFRPEFPAEDRERMNRFFKTLTPSHPVDVIEHRIIMKDGSIRWQRWSDRAIFDPAGNLIEYQSVGRDITETKETEEALRESERKFRLLAENSQDIIERHTADARCLYVSPACRTLLGYDPEELTGHSVVGILHPDDVPVIVKYRKSISPNNPSAKVSFRIRHKDGHYIWAEAVFRGVFDQKSGELLEIFSISRDITEQKETEDALRQMTEDLDSRNRLIGALLDTVPIGIFMVESPSGKPIVANREATRLLGRGILPDATEENLAVVYEAYRAGTTQRYPAEEMPIVRGMHGESRHIDDLVVIRPDGTPVQLEIFGTPITDGQGNVTASLVSFLDITERKRAEQALQAAQEKYTKAFHSVSDAMTISELDSGRFIEVNEAATALFGYPREELIGKSAIDLGIWQNAEDRAVLIDQLKKHTGIHEYEVIERRKSGELYTALVNADILTIGNRECLLSIIRDISERKRAEEMLKDSETRFSSLFNTSPVPLLLTEPETGRMLAINDAAANLFEYSMEEMLGNTTTDLGIWADPEERRRQLKIFRDTGSVRDAETRIRLKSGQIRSVIFTSVTVESEGSTAILTAISDITERKRAEQVIREANRKINLLTSITRHDVANQIAVVRGFTKIALNKKPDPAVAGLLKKIDEAVSTIARQIEFTKAYQELGVQVPGWHRIRDIVAQQKTAGISLSCTCNAEVYADPMLERVFFNLVDNAIRHGEKVTAITVSCRQDSGNLMIVVADNGIGVPPDLKEMIFEKGFGKHTGYGLFLTREILGITGITIRETGTYKKGARFEITVPKGSFRVIS